jgi:hypothetical protein
VPRPRREALLLGLGGGIGVGTGALLTGGTGFAVGAFVLAALTVILLDAGIGAT